jgi:hypothetical protein
MGARTYVRPYPSCKYGAEGIRTPDLLHAKEALSQLSYGPRSFLIFDFGFLIGP